MASNKPYVTKAPKGLAITRKGYNFTFSWTNGETYKDCDIIMKINGKPKKGIPIKPGANDLKVSKITVKLPYKYKGRKYTPVTSVAFTVRGLRKSALSKSEKKTYSKIVESPYVKKWAVYKIDFPAAPSVSAAWDSTGENKTVFSWSIPDADNANHKWFLQTRYRIGYCWKGQKWVWYPKNKKGKLDWYRSSSPKGSWGRPEQQLPETPFVRRILVYSVGRRGVTPRKKQKKKTVANPKIIQHVYSKPAQPANLKVNKVSDAADGIRLEVQWLNKIGFWYPVDRIEVDYAISQPALGMTAPKNLSNTVLATHYPHKQADYTSKAYKEFDRRLEDNECLFWRVRAIHDNNVNNTAWQRVAGLRGKLSRPSDVSIDSEMSDNILRVNVDNTAESDVPNSFLLVKYKTIGADGVATNPIVIGIKPNPYPTTGPSYVDVRIPDDINTFTGEIKIGVKAVAYPLDTFYAVKVTEQTFPMLIEDLYYFNGTRVTNPVKASLKNYYEKNSGVYVKTKDTDVNPKHTYYTGSYVKVLNSDSYSSTKEYFTRIKLEAKPAYSNLFYKQYSMPDLAKIQAMESEEAWQSGDFPKPPANFEIVSVDSETARCTWSWSWNGATYVELSWSEYEDAWESTEEPSNYIIPVNKATAWNIKGLDPGTTWYARARFIREVGDAQTAGPWSVAKPLNLKSAPAVPNLQLSRNVVTEDQDFVASWTYISTDGNPQSKGEIFFYVNDDNGARYGRYRPAVELLLKDDQGAPIFEETNIYYTLNEGAYVRVTTPVEADIASYYMFDESSYLLSTGENSTAQQITSNASALGLAPGSYQIALRVTSTGGISSPWSTSQTLEVVEPLDPPVISAIAQMEPETVEDVVYGNTYTLTSDTDIQPNKEYWTLTSEAVIEPVEEDLDIYYEMSNDVYFKTSDTVIVEGKQYYIVESNSVIEPSVEDISQYYERDFTTSYRSRLALRRLPIEMNVTGAGSDGETIITIERTTEFFTDKPDETVGRGYEGEIVFLQRSPGEGTIRITQDDLMGDLDDTASYKLNVSVIDANDQTAEEEHIIASVTSENFERLKNILFLRTDEKPYVYYVLDDYYRQTEDESIVPGKTYYIEVEGQYIAVENPVVEDISTYFEFQQYTFDPNATYYYKNEFVVAWDHQPAIPDVKIEPDYENLAVKITANVPTEYPEGTPYTPEDGDVIDIYRLSVDAPELIVSGGAIGQTYVDPYPAFGEFGGHRVVYRTANGDYRTEDKLDSWMDTGEEQNDRIDTEYSVINFERDSVNVLYNINLSNSWKKDFTETKYLGGHVQGDWNPAVSRTGSLSTVSVTSMDQETIKSMRRLADHAGIAHVRTRDGSSYAANVEVSETMNYDSYDLVSYNLNITRVDSESYDGMTLEEWEKYLKLIKE